MGVVLLVHDEALDRQVAAKLVHAHVLEIGSARDSFLAEARAMARVGHPNVVEIFAFGDHQGRPFFTMEYVPGPTLGAYHAQRDHGPMAFDEVIRILEGIAAGVDAIHESGTVHGDIKPSNILIGPGERLRVTDFGLTARGEDAFLGTPSYVAPERIERKTVPHLRSRVDVYSFAVIAHELLSGRLPFEAPDVGRVYAQHLYKQPPPVTALRPDLPSAVDVVLTKAMTKDPGERSAGVMQVLEGLREARRRMRPTRRVLIADDDPDFRALVRACLEIELGVDTIEEVSNGRDALMSLSSRHFDLAVIDLHMPRMNGLELTASIREKIPPEDLRILVVTGHGSASDWRVLSRLGADAFVVKPLDPTSFISTAEPLLY